MVDIAAIESLFEYLTDEEKAELDGLLADGRIWQPLPGPQQMAYDSQADIIGYGGAAGGGKTDLACGKALTQHRKAMILRREGTELTAIIDRLTELLGGRDGYNGQDRIWRTAKRQDVLAEQIEFGSVPNAGEERKYQGRPHDLLVFDEAVNFLESQVRFLLGWLRTTVAGQRCQALLAFNPPTSAEGQWIIKFFAPWLDDKHPRPAKPGELRWFATVNGEDLEVEDARPFVLVDGERLYDFDPRAYSDDEIIKPLSRTFIPSRITDNPYLVGTGYMRTLQGMPEPLRSQMLNGDFKAGIKDDPWQVIPTAWVDAAMARWKPRDQKGRMVSMGQDVARGGDDNTIIARRHTDMWFDEPLTYPGKETPDGPTGAGYAIAARRDRCPVHVDVIGWGSSVYDSLKANEVQAIAINGAAKSYGVSKDGSLQFANLRSEVHWKMREALDPANDTGIALPNDPRLRADLCAPTWSLRGGKVQVESKEDIIKRIGRSPDWGDAYILANIDTPRHEDFPGRQGAHSAARRAYNPNAKAKRT